MSLIGITGRAGAGKTYLANELVTLFDNGTRISFAAQLRKEIEEVMGADCPNLWRKPTSPEARWIMQQYGTEFRRKEDPNYWVNKGMQEAYVLIKMGHTVVFDDIRFPNEGDAVRREGGILVRVVNSVATRQLRLGALPPNHASETSMHNYDVDFTITGTPGVMHERQLRSILVEVGHDNIDFGKLLP